MDRLPAPIDPVPDPWPLHGLVLRTPRLELRPDDDGSLRELVTMLHATGVHPASAMPFSVPWTDADPRYLGRGVVQYFWSERARTGPESWALHLVVRSEGRVIGLQSLTADRFGLLRGVETGSYLGLSYQGTGYGTEMRAAVLAFAFDHLGATTARSDYVEGNDASAAVSRRLGYRADGTSLNSAREVRTVQHRVLLTPEEFVRPGWELGVRGYTDELAGFLGAQPPRGG
ncbi:MULTISPECIES: GNAT family N-acetyltransferase [Pseudonocardia]|uniref:N-acetyltransferase n=2 Tax=Pseudonocardia TaxID=1847 RepID=A0ABQ0RTY9_9PSEU|nr:MULTISPECIES: GNAT family protein [Pseudonocardia]OSY42188.1 putative succinyl-CoA transferase [Pseudonocardia autotrophica]TDN75046.1 RimJ/RimL family protein N-acetyltransferase [Pseudonocardia autotrophica]BBF98988.1 N-acetyltransferase [Pseudonocardia autotrophica]GEC23908.1 N-acetyltransferase [Pseudonocardia saturnea]